MAQKNISNNSFVASNKSIFEVQLNSDVLGNPITLGAFTPTGNTVAFLANTAAPAPVQAVQSANVSYCQYRIFNSGTNLVFLGVANTSVAANTNANVVTTSGNSVPILPGTLEVITFVSNAYFTGMTSSGNSQIYVTPGIGM